MNRRTLLCLALPLLLSTQTGLVRGTTRSEIGDTYKWKPEHIYTSIAGWDADMKAVREGIDQLAAFQGRFAGKDAKDPAQTLIAFNKLRESVEIKFDHAGNYVSHNYDVDMSSSEWGGREQQVHDLAVYYGQKLSWLEPELLEIPPETMMGYVAKYPELAAYKKTYEDMYALRKHTLSAPEEEILALSGNITGTAADVYSKMTDVDLDMGTIVDEKGDTIKCDYSGWVSHSTSKDRRVREDYFKAVWGGYKHYETTLAALMAGNIKKDIYLTKARKYDNTLQAALDNNFIPVNVYTNLVATTRANTAPLQKYDMIRKRILGVDHLRHWDYYVNLVEGDETRYTYENGIKMVFEALKPLGKDYIADITKALDPKNGWVDLYASDGKRGGAYSSSTYGIHPYMLYNFDYKKGLTLDDVSTVAHEVGHSMHTYYSEKTQPFPNKDYAIFNAEVASTTNETLMQMKMLDDARKAYKNAKGKEKEAAKQHLIYLLQTNIDGTRGTFYRQVMFATWEWEAHKMGEAGQPLTAESFNKLYGDLLKEWQGSTMEYEELSNSSWSTIPHFYRGYYVYAYATSYTAAVALAQDIRAEANGDASKKGAVKKYLEYLHSGSAKHPVELLKDAGVDMTTPAPILSLVKYFTALVDELDALTKKKG